MTDKTEHEYLARIATAIELISANVSAVIVKPDTKAGPGRPSKADKTDATPPSTPPANETAGTPTNGGTPANGDGKDAPDLNAVRMAALAVTNHYGKPREEEGRKAIRAIVAKHGADAMANLAPTTFSQVVAEMKALIAPAPAAPEAPADPLDGL